MCKCFFLLQIKLNRFDVKKNSNIDFPLLFALMKHSDESVE